jgi:hypothetical protein
MDTFNVELAEVFNRPDLCEQRTETLGMGLAVTAPEALQKFVAAAGRVLSLWENVKSYIDLAFILLSLDSVETLHRGLGAASPPATRWPRIRQ